jgi:inosine/xanthosine triphosphatase
VPDQPQTDDETLLGALNRAGRAKKRHPEADFWVGLEGGIHTTLNQTQSFAWAVVKSASHTGKSRTASFTLPKAVVKLLKQGKELGDAMDIIYNRHHSKHQEGAVGILTHGLITRSKLYQQAVTLALIPFTD